MNDFAKNILLWVVVAIVLMAVLNNFSQTQQARQEVPYSQFLEQVRNGDVQSVEFKDGGRTVQFEGPDKRRGVTYLAYPDRDLYNDLNAKGVEFQADKPETGPSWLAIIINLLPLVLIIGIFIFFMRQLQSGGGGKGAMSFGRSKAKLQGEDQVKVTFADVAGCDEAKEEVGELVEFLRDPGKFQKLGGRIPRGVLMVGSPGTGKTLLAKAIAGEAKVPFFSISGSDFVEMFVGVGASRVRDMFEQAKQHAPCIIFIDEIDAVGRHRGAGLGGGNDEREQTLNQILVEMDGFDSQTNIVIIAATNRPDILDPALLRPGRFDRKVVVDRPDRKGREAILKVHVKGKPIAPDVDLGEIAAQTPGMVGADLENLINEAAILAARRNKRAITMDELRESIERVMAGPARRSRVLDERDRQTIAYHEAGHAIVMEQLDFADMVGKITIVSRGQALGYVMPLPEDDRSLKSRAEYEDELAGLLGGRAAEEIIFDEPSTGASNDLERVTKLAKAMVTRFGMSDTIGPMQLQQGDSNPFMGMEFGEQRTYSEDVARKIDVEVRRIVEKAHAKARHILTTNRDKLNLIAETLLEKEVLERDEFLALMEEPATV